MGHPARLEPSPPSPSAVEIEAKMKEQAAIQAMMDDLGKARVNQLPLDDGSKNSHGAHHFRNSGPSTQRRYFPVLTPSLNDVWKAAIAAGAFDDEDAEGVKNLDDLGGGRIYDNAASGRSQKNRVVDVTMKMLDQRDLRSTYHRAEHVAQKRKAPPCGNGDTASHFAQANNTRILTPSAGSRSKAENVNLLARLERLSPSPAPPSLPVPMPEVVIDTNALLPVEVANVLFKNEVNFFCRDVNPAMRAIIILSDSKKPHLGFFTVVMFKRIYCQWAMSAWYDYSSGADNLLVVTFQDKSTVQGYQLYFDTYDDLTEFVETARSLRAGEHSAQADSVSISASNTPVTMTNKSQAPAISRTNQLTSTTFSQARATDMQAAYSASVAVQNSKVDSELHGNVRASVNLKPAINSMALLSQAVPLANGVVPTGQDPAANPSIEEHHVSEYMYNNYGVNDNKPNATTTIHRPSQHTLSFEQASITEQNAPKVSRQNDGSAGATTEEHDTETTGLLSTLESYRHGEGADINESSMRMFRNTVSGTARLFFQFFCFSEVVGKTRTVEELDQIAKGVKTGFLKHTVRNAKAQGFTEKQVQAIRDEINKVFDSELANKLNEHQALRSSRPSYTLDELLSLRDRATKPPGCLADMSYLPKPGNVSRQASLSSQSLSAFTLQVGSWDTGEDGERSRAAFDRSQVAKAVNAMDWVLGTSATVSTECQKSKAASDKPQINASTVVGNSVAADTGLQSSRWASGTAEIKAANSFTGPRYEKMWSKHSYLEELARLQPRVRVTTGTEELMDLYFPLANDVDTPTSSAASQSFGDGHQVPATTSAGSGTSTPKQRDKIEIARVGASQLPTSSPTAPQLQSSQPSPSPGRWSFTFRTLGEVCAQPASTAVQPAPKAAQPVVQHQVRGLAASRHSAGARTSSSGKFKFHTSNPARQC
ncbi:hypothetical protein C7999DRAFT_10603 [Corynascus novoguineensis]|uniref:Uncharacterized protein n=1 Tax=Corynascus novoguineensis TaxID=1126955 RepID=A0AAN7D0Y9_9PEZI|nr:hypothetical protein C7999DRAFT_10603 [Corynascus novoguineensis]